MKIKHWNGASAFKLRAMLGPLATGFTCLA
jgi:hypothetical protein